MFDIRPVRRNVAIMAATLAASLSFLSVAEAGGKGKPPKIGNQQTSRGSHYQDHRNDHYQDHRSGEDDRNFGGAASSGIRIRCILPFCGHSFTPNAPPHYQDHRNDPPHYQDHRNDPVGGRPRHPRDPGYQNPYMPNGKAKRAAPVKHKKQQVKAGRKKRPS
jgi:hypothetical protein